MNSIKCSLAIMFIAMLSSCSMNTTTVLRTCASIQRDMAAATACLRDHMCYKDLEFYKEGFRIQHELAQCNRDSSGE